MQLVIQNSVDMYSYRDPLFGIIQIGMSMVYSVFASEFCNTNVSLLILCTYLFCKMIYATLTLFFFVTGLSL